MLIWRLFKVGCLTFLVMLASCKGDDINVNTESDRLYSGAMPAINYSFTIADGIKELDDDRIFVDEDKLVSFKFDQDVSMAWDKLASIDDLNESWSYVMTNAIVTPAPPLNQSGNISTQEKIKFNSKNDVRLDEAHFKNGDLALSITVPPGVTGTIVVSIPESSPVITTTLQPDGINNSFNPSFSMKDRKIVFEQETNSSYVTLNMEAHLNFPGVPAGEINLAFNLADIKTERLYGYFGQYQSNSITVTQEIEDMEDFLGSANIELKDVTYTIQSNNQMGVPFHLEASNIRFNKKVDGNETSKLLLIKDVSKIEMEVSAATDDSPIKPGTDTFIVKQSDSNLKDIVNPFPDEIIVDFVSFSNPEGDTGVRNFIGDVDSLFATVEVEAPLWLKAKDYTRKDTIDFDFKDLMDNNRENADLIEKLAMHLDFYNLLPFAVDANLFVADANGNKIEDILSDFESFIAAGVPNAAGRISDAEHTNVLVEFDNRQILKFFDENAMLLILETKIASYNYANEFVKIFDDAGLNVSISFEATGQVLNFN